MPSEFPNKLDYTMLSTFLTCRKKYYWRIVRGLVGKKPPTAAEFGRCIHAALDSWFTDKDEDKAVATFAELFIENPEDEKRTLAVGKKLLSLYFDKYRNQNVKTVASELNFNVPIPGSPVALIGRIDKVVEWGDALWIMDHKTTSALGSTFFYKIKPNMQFDGYIYAARQLGYNVVGIVLDALLVAKGLVVPAQLSRLTPLGRDYSTREENEIEDYLSDVKDIIEELQGCYAKDRWYRNTESCCDFIECPYRRICKEHSSLHEKIVSMDFMVSPWSPDKEVVDGKL